MALTPLEVRKQEFKKGMSGYNAQEVRNFLNLVAEELENQARQNAALTERIKELDVKIEDYRRMEKLLQDTMTTTQEATNQIRENAKKEAETIVEQAKLEGDRILKATRDDETKLRQELSVLENQKMGLISEIKGTLETYMKMLDQLEKGEK
jgi:cell division initiation protein